MSTKDKILRAALKLFNEGNTQKATTNHIAKELGMSPGNLHYHYKNREEIIRILYKEFREKMTLDEETLPKTFAEIIEHQKYLMQVVWEYRFFYSEITFLFSRDSELEKIYVRDNLAHKQRIVKVIKNLIANGEIEILDEHRIEHIADNVLITHQFYLSYLRTLGKGIDKNGIEESIAYTNDAFRPFLTKKAFS